jgi:alpha-glucosidase (family GH31 glycosyl hydrolase)
MQNHTEIGHVDFREEKSFKILLWKTESVKMNMVVGKTMKEVVSGITHFVGRMKKLP